jgi:hypothetical protein
MPHQTPLPTPEPSAARGHADALWVVALYALFVSLWILLSDHLLALWVSDPQTAEVVAILKGWVFVGVTSVLLYFLIWQRISVNPNARSDAALVRVQWPARPRRWLIYLLAIAVTLATLFVRTRIAVSFGERPLLILLMFPILLSATVGGLGPGLTATLCAALGIDYVAIPPVGSLRIAATLLDPEHRRPLPWPAPPTDFGAQEALLLGREGEVPVRMRCSAINPAPDGEPGRVLVLHDIREERAAVLMRERADLKRLIQTLPDLVWLNADAGNGRLRGDAGVAPAGAWSAGDRAHGPCAGRGAHPRSGGRHGRLPDQAPLIRSSWSRRSAGTWHQARQPPGDSARGAWPSRVGAVTEHLLAELAERSRPPSGPA